MGNNSTSEPNNDNNKKTICTKLRSIDQNKLYRLQQPYQKIGCYQDNFIFFYEQFEKYPQLINQYEKIQSEINSEDNKFLIKNYFEYKKKFYNKINMKFEHEHLQKLNLFSNILDSCLKLTFDEQFDQDYSKITESKYRGYLSSVESQNNLYHKNCIVIDNDIDRTQSKHPLFKSNEFQNSMSNLIKATLINTRQVQHKNLDEDLSNKKNSNQSIESVLNFNQNNLKTSDSQNSINSYNSNNDSNSIYPNNENIQNNSNNINRISLNSIQSYNSVKDQQNRQSIKCLDQSQGQSQFIAYLILILGDELKVQQVAMKLLNKYQFKLIQLPNFEFVKFIANLTHEQVNKISSSNSNLKFIYDLFHTSCSEDLNMITSLFYSKIIISIFCSSISLEIVEIFLKQTICHGIFKGLLTIIITIYELIYEFIFIDTGWKQENNLINGRDAGAFSYIFNVWRILGKEQLLDLAANSMTVLDMINWIVKSLNLDEDAMFVHTAIFKSQKYVNDKLNSFQLDSKLQTKLFDQLIETEGYEFLKNNLQNVKCNKISYVNKENNEIKIEDDRTIGLSLISSNSVSYDIYKK